jgi:hypothetical protein
MVVDRHRDNAVISRWLRREGDVLDHDERRPEPLGLGDRELDRTPSTVRSAMKALSTAGRLDDGDDLGAVFPTMQACGAARFVDSSS